MEKYVDRYGKSLLCQCYVVICCYLIAEAGLSLEGVLLCISAILVLPIKILNCLLLNIIPRWNSVKYLIVFILFVLGCVL